ncbi:hypothetical protein D3C80_813040 [compost metagenome]
MTIIASPTASKKVTSGRRSRSGRREAAKPKKTAKTTMPRMASSAAARIGLDGAMVFMNSLKGADAPMPAGAAGWPASSKRAPSGSMGHRACSP